jgi:hypothetical protein
VTDVLLFANLPDYLREDISNGNGRCICPRCDGGNSREASLDVRQDAIGVIKLKCYRASCGWFGISVTDPDAKLQSRAIKKPSIYREETHPLDAAMTTRLTVSYGCNVDYATQHGWRQRASALVLPIHDPYGQVRGHVTRTFATPKRVMTYKATAQPWLDHWKSASEVCVVVEDCISALRLASIGYSAVALLGTGLSVDQAKEIQEHYGKGKIILALDNDAFVKSLHMAKRHGHVVQMKPVCLTEDIKNMNHDADIIRVLGVAPSTS